MSKPIATKTHPVAEVLKPGSVVIRPTREDAEQDINHFYTLLNGFRERRELPLKKIAYITGDETGNPEVSVSKKITSRTLPREARDFILRHVFETGQLLTGTARRQISAFDDALYFALLSFYSAKETSQDKARARVGGTYKFWRYSAEHDNEYIFGKMVFKEDPETRALRATLVQAKQPYQGEQGLVESFTGYFFRLSHMYFI